MPKYMKSRVLYEYKSDNIDDVLSSLYENIDHEALSKNHKIKVRKKFKVTYIND